MVHRSFWINRIERAWSRKSLLWLYGVRRVGKTSLCQSLPEASYFDCELPHVRQRMADPQDFLERLRGQRVVLDEVHRLENPSELLKIAADHYPDVRILATGSSTRFRDMLTGRKEELWLTPLTSGDLRDFSNPDLRHRCLRGGLPPFFLSPELPEQPFAEWWETYWARDIQELFRLGRRQAFLKLAELLLAQSGGIFEASRLAAPCELSRPTVVNYLGVLEATLVFQVLRPFGTRASTEIIQAPKVYAFDTGFVCFQRGWRELRNEDLGHLWEHVVLNELGALLQTRRLHYWRDKRGHEVDFVLSRRGGSPTVVECKWSASEFDPAGLRAFRSRYPGGPEGANLVICRDAEETFRKTFGDLQVTCAGLSHLPDALGLAPP